jgi:hypothetical protein
MDTQSLTLPESLTEELSRALSSISYGSIELIVQDNVVTQITIRNIKKTSVNMIAKPQKEKSHGRIVVSPFKNSIPARGKLQIKLRP